MQKGSVDGSLHNDVLETRDDEDEDREVKSHDFTGVLPGTGSEPETHADEEVASDATEQTWSPTLTGLGDGDSLGVSDHVGGSVDVGIVSCYVNRDRVGRRQPLTHKRGETKSAGKVTEENDDPVHRQLPSLDPAFHQSHRHEHCGSTMS